MPCYPFSLECGPGKGLFHRHYLDHEPDEKISQRDCQYVTTEPLESMLKEKQQKTETDLRLWMMSQG